MSTLTTNGHVTVPAPTPVFRKGGILDVAEVLPLQPHEQMGVQYESLASFPATQVTEDGTTCIAAALDEDDLHGFDWTDGDSAFFIYTGVECTALGNTMEEFQRVAMDRLEVGSSRAVEQHLWTQTFSGAVDLNPAGAVSMARGLAILAEYAGANYAYSPLIHFGLGTNVYLTETRLVNFDGKLPVGVGDPVVGSGYLSLEGPGTPAVAADPGEAWIYATGRVVVRQGTIESHTATNTLGAAPTNSMIALAVRPYVVTIDGFAVAIRVTLES